MTISATDHWFSASIRRNRQSYIFASLLLLAVMGLVFLAMWYFEARNLFGEVVFLIFFVPFVICQYFLTAQRLRDMNVTGWLALLWIPIGMADEGLGGALSLAAFLILATVPGTKGPNRYGPDPLDEQSWDYSRV